ncbi:hypothetical protein BKA70DRAFT_1253756 [Coprinopsis sp. MPI-PUGE-AT-0042]|nr:hypothetical protein BKA70DRAFT_1253756 [Coprinopsis sp. MPI-PUGE-AT-0042]
MKFWQGSVQALLGMSTPPKSAPVDCLSTSSTLQDLASCFLGYVVPEGFYDAGGFGGPTSYAVAQPNSTELTAWKDTIYAMLDADITGDCPTSQAAVPGLEGYTVGMFTETAGQRPKSYCVLSETSTYPGTTNVFARGWGFVITPVNTSDHLRALHFSAPHPLYDSSTPTQAVALFQRVGAKSVVAAGRHRMASTDVSGCAKPSSEASTYYKTDPSHDDREPFHDALLVTRDWQNEQGGCPNDHCAYVQWHRKWASCPQYDAFFSSGPGNGQASHDWYHGAVIHPVRRLKEALDVRLPPLPNTTHGMPSVANDCQLTATKNIFGRIVNGRVPPTHCTMSAALSNVTGEFIHIEQTTALVQEEHYDAWAEALADTFPVLKPAP